MKRALLILASILMLMTCATKDWDSGADAQRSYDEQQRQEQTENMNIQFPDSRSGTDTSQPF